MPKFFLLIFFQLLIILSNKTIVITHQKHPFCNFWHYFKTIFFSPPLSDFFIKIIFNLFPSSIEELYHSLSTREHGWILQNFLLIFQAQNSEQRFVSNHCSINCNLLSFFLYSLCNSRSFMLTMEKNHTNDVNLWDDKRIFKITI